MLPKIYIGDYYFKTYHISTLVALILGTILGIWALKKIGLTYLKSFILLLISALMFLIGARTWYMLHQPLGFACKAFKWYSFELTGFSINGGFIGVFIVLFLFAKYTKTPLYSILDRLTPPSILAFCIARIGCFLTGCCEGKRTDSFLGVAFKSGEKKLEAINKLLIFTNFKEYKSLPTQLFELFGAFLGLLIALYLVKKYKLKSGSLFLITGIFFFVTRIIVLPFRSFAFGYPKIILSYSAIYGLCIIVGLFALKKLLFPSIPKKE